MRLKHVAAWAAMAGPAGLHACCPGSGSVALRDDHAQAASPGCPERSTCAIAVNGKGWSAGFAELVSTQNGETLYRYQAVRWRVSQAEALPTDTTLFSGSHAYAINTSGEVAGEVLSANDPSERHAAVWDLNGTLRLLDQTPGQGTRAVAMADNGTVLVERTVVTDSETTVSLELHANGRITVLMPPSPGVSFAPGTDRSLSADGSIVVGSWVMPLPPGQNFVLRAFVHKQGLTQDLTDMAKAKGVKLPTGAYFSAAAGINAKGSILATYVDSKGMNPLQVRLTPAR